MMIVVVVAVLMVWEYKGIIAFRSLYSSSCAGFLLLRLCHLYSMKHIRIIYCSKLLFVYLFRCWLMPQVNNPDGWRWKSEIHMFVYTCIHYNILTIVRLTCFTVDCEEALW